LKCGDALYNLYKSRLWEGLPVEKALAEQLQDVIDALLVAQSKAQLAARTIREQRLYLGLGLNHPDAEIARLISNLQYTKLLAENKARGVTAKEQDSSPAQDVDGRLVSLSDAGDALVVNSVQDATALPSAIPVEIEGLTSVDDKSAGDALTEPVNIPPPSVQPPAAEDPPAVQQGTPGDVDGLPPVGRPDTDGA
jgi:hypothetical protein